MINNKNLEDENWKLIAVNQINDKIIKDLVKNLHKEVSDDFYISIESLLKLGEKAKSELKASLNELEETFLFKKNILNVLLNTIEDKEIERAFLLQLYHTDFTIRANSILHIEATKNLKYLPYLLPLIEDPDDSVRWTLINSLSNLNQIQSPKVLSRLKTRLNKEPNQVIKKRLESILPKY